MVAFEAKSVCFVRKTSRPSYVRSHLEYLEGLQHEVRCLLEQQRERHSSRALPLRPPPLATVAAAAGTTSPLAALIVIIRFSRPALNPASRYRVSLLLFYLTRALSG